MSTTAFITHASDILKAFSAIIVLIYYCFYNSIKFLIPYKHRAKSISGELALVTGAGSGIGKSLAKKLSSLGCTLICWDIDSKANEQTALEIEQSGGKAKAYKVDLSKRENVYEVGELVKRELGNPTILVNNAGIVTGKKFLDCDDRAIEKTMQVNTMAHFWTVKTFLPYMLDKNHGHLVSIASMAGIFGVSGLCDYSASKFAAVGFNESLTSELKKLQKNGVETTVVCPVGVNTGLFNGFKLSVPMMDVDYVTDRIVEAILTNQKTLILPRSLWIIMSLKYLVPYQFVEYVDGLLKGNEAMDTFVGRQKSE